MKFISNTGKMKQVRYSSGILKNIPEGSCSCPDDPNLDKLVNSSSDLTFISQAEFYKQKEVATTEEKIKEAKKEIPAPRPPKKQKNKKDAGAPEEKLEENTEELQGE